MTFGSISGLQPWLDAWVRFPSLRTGLAITPFLLDTGSTVSVVQPLDATRIGIDLAALFPDPRSVAIPGFGGEIRMLMTSAEIAFDTNEPARLVRLGIIEPTTRTWELPSVLGMDFLQHFRFTISVLEGVVELHELP